jgi:hypothetical protein
MAKTPMINRAAELGKIPGGKITSTNSSSANRLVLEVEAREKRNWPSFDETGAIAAVHLSHEPEMC